jgi:hypothetical protein
MTVVNRFGEWGALPQGGDTVVLLNSGDGTFVEHARHAPPGTNTTPWSVALGDLDDDGDLDTVVVVLGVRGVLLYFNAGDGILADPVGYDLEEGVIDVALCDVDADGDLDMLVVERERSFSVLLNAGDGRLIVDRRYELPRPPSAIATRDVDGDGDVDVAVMMRDDFSSDSSMLVYRNAGDGTLTEDLRYRAGREPSAIGFGDLDGDGAPELVVVNAYAGNLWALPNDGAGTYVHDVRSSVASVPSAIALGDLDGNGRLDLMARELGSVSTYRGSGDGGSSTTPATRSRRSTCTGSRSGTSMATAISTRRSPVSTCRC